MIAHIVHFTPKSELSEDSRQRFASLVVDVLRTVPQIARVTIGRKIDVDPGYGRSMGGAPHAFAVVLEFAGRADLVTYLRHPRHAELGQAFWECCESATVTEVECRDLRDPAIVDFLVARENASA